jgi:hypothetical protein
MRFLAGLTLPPTTPRPDFSSLLYTSTHKFPGPTLAYLLSFETATVSNLFIETVIPPSMLDAPAKAA